MARKGFAHGLTEVDVTTMRAVCATCGPTEIKRKAHPVCLVGWQRLRDRDAAKYATPEGKSQAFARNLAWKFGLTPEQWEAKFDAQGRRCMVCKTDTPNGGKGWCVDHDHLCCPGRRSCGKCLRDILCHRCNVAVGLFGDDASIILAAARYVFRHLAAKMPPE